MKNVVLSACALMGVCAVHAQATRKIVDEALVNKEMKADTSKKGPTKVGGIIALNLNQQNSSFWVGANERYALNVGISADVYANTTWKKSTLNNTLKMNYAWLNNQSQGVRKTADFIDLFSKYGRQLRSDGKLAVATIANLRTQFTNGYDYSASPRRRTSGFFAPANVLLTPGVEWRPSKAFSIFASPFAARWVIVSNDPFSYSFPGGVRPDGSRETPLAELFGVDPETKVSGQFGAFVSASANTPLVKNVNYSARIDLYSNYRDRPQNIDIFWTNNIIFKVNKWLGITYQFNIAYDHDIVPAGENGPRTQFLGNLGIGVTGKF